eukprot:CAMPEP_0201524698 /NCGR_PEP_ID=MMETSP0161_2-20130828/24501_1 /ASSEMBLY_ACC=CAM_ASM_000251 /TAXON_ID=180227 /ORGANISM="Neoparamoeba aestuarina, Strain SoJaBio B1-5/56/2" /LENGTH=135 /DNA_ID=CAMNT_0047924227 /DNA_START=501 /DNA_END=905 /DNA_ORIENTATION=-
MLYSKNVEGFTPIGLALALGTRHTVLAIQRNFDIFGDLPEEVISPKFIRSSLNGVFRLHLEQQAELLQEVGLMSRDLWKFQKKEGEGEGGEEGERQDEEGVLDAHSVPFPILKEMIPFTGFPNLVRQRLFAQCLA